MMIPRQSTKQPSGDPLRSNRARMCVAGVLAVALAAPMDAASPAPQEGSFALIAAKALTCSEDRPVIDRAVILVRGGQIAAIGGREELEIPSNLEIVDLGDRWVMPGMVDLHSHIAGTRDINGAVYQTNPGLRVRCSVVPDNANLRRGLAAGVTSILFIPGSATAIGGQGVLLKTSQQNFEGMVLRDPGSMKLAQADNPKRWGWGMGRLSINYQIRDVLRRGVHYARAWESFERGEGPEPDMQPGLEIFRALAAGHAQVSAHTQVYQVVYQTCRQVVEEAGLPLYIDHGTFDGFLAAEYADSLGVPAILGPRVISSQNKGRGIDHDGRILGVAAEYQRRGHRHIGFNTDAWVVPQEELPLQAAMGVRYGYDDEAMGTVRGLTIEPARAAGIDEQVGSLEVGKDADIVVVSGHPSDPRNGVECVWVDGVLAYDAREGRRF